MNKLFNGNSQVELDSVWNNIKQKQETETKTDSNQESNSDSNQESNSDSEIEKRKQ